MKYLVIIKDVIDLVLLILGSFAFIGLLTLTLTGETI
jgi:hypothetical protein